MSAMTPDYDVPEAFSESRDLGSDGPAGMDELNIHELEIRHTLLSSTDAELESGAIAHIPSFTSSKEPGMTPDERLERYIGSYGNGIHVYNALMHGANPNLRDAQGMPMLHRAVAYPFDVDDLAKHGAELNAKDMEGNTALHLAVSGNHVDTVRRLLAHGADPNIHDKQGLKPSELADNEASKLFESERHNPLLKHFEEQVNHRTQEVESVLFRRDATEVRVELENAFDAGWDVDVRDEVGRSLVMAYVQARQPRALEDAIRYGVDVNAQDKYGRTALMMTDRVEMTEILLRNGANPNLVDNDQRTALHHNGHSSFGSYHELLLKHGADINAQDRRGDTLLHHQVERRQSDWEDEHTSMGPWHSTHMVDRAIRAAVQAGADSTIKNKDGFSAGEMYIAQEGKDPTTHMVLDAQMTRDKLKQTLATPAVKRSKSLRL